MKFQFRIISKNIFSFLNVSILKNQDLFLILLHTRKQIRKYKRDGLVSIEFKMRIE